MRSMRNGLTREAPAATEPVTVQKEVFRDPLFMHFYLKIHLSYLAIYPSSLGLKPGPAECA